MKGRSIDSEKRIEKKLAKDIKAMGGWCLKLPAIHIAGLPDRLCLLPGGVIFFAELKTTGQKRRRIQEVTCSKIENLGFRVVVIDSIRGITCLLNEYK